MVKEFNAAQWLTQGMKIFKRELIRCAMKDIAQFGIKTVDGYYTVMYSNLIGTTGKTVVFRFKPDNLNNIEVAAYNRDGTMDDYVEIEELKFITLQLICKYILKLDNTIK
jgi:hypothetical protein